MSRDPIVHGQMSPGPPCPWTKESWAWLSIDRGTLGPVVSFTAGLDCPLHNIWGQVDKGDNQALYSYTFGVCSFALNSVETI